ncbi:hypothetical protein [Micromonospora sp. NPDC023737]|uniref:hypothetical protein n=1 Tax=unclassified Micromonospora TaxID=2617518 RepID=UPI00340F0A9A
MEADDPGQEGLLDADADHVDDTGRRHSATERPGGGTNIGLIGGLLGTALLAFGAALAVFACRRHNAIKFTA